MNIFFDMDYTLIGLTGTLRPMVPETFHRLIEDGHTLHIWSGIGDRRDEVRRLGLDRYVAGVYVKPIEDFEAQVRARLQRNELATFPDLVVDDHPEIVSALGGIVVRAYFAGDRHDTEMERVYQIISDYTAHGSSSDGAFRPRPAHLSVNGNGHHGGTLPS